MKRIFSSLLPLMICAAASAAEPPKPTAGTNVMSIDCRNGFEYAAPTASYKGSVVVIDPQMKLTCELLTVYFSTNQTNSGRIETIVAVTDVVIHQQDTIATGEQAVYTATNDVVTLTGNAQLDTPQGVLRGAIIILDRKNNTLYAPGKVFMQGKPNTGLFGTNSLGITLPGPKAATTNTVPPKPSETKK